ncbi:hypothetical protein Syun_010129 [Stephania yunnanensis]|uniref:Uncharacterized protein n=1 Tax=Stephania yunnanensis TaxID=152371 RepID=A0AAP0KGY1_9MAGN
MGGREHPTSHSSSSPNHFLVLGAAAASSDVVDSAASAALGFQHLSNATKSPSPSPLSPIFSDSFPESRLGNPLIQVQSPHFALEFTPNLLLPVQLHDLESFFFQNMGDPQSDELQRNVVGPWFANAPVCGISPLRLLFLRSKVTSTGKFPSDLRISPEKRLSPPGSRRRTCSRREPASATACGSGTLSGVVAAANAAHQGVHPIFGVELRRRCGERVGVVKPQRGGGGGGVGEVGGGGGDAEEDEEVVGEEDE